MTPAARVATAIEVLDAIQAGQPAEQALTGWARASRFAGSKDRAAVRDHVYDVLRRKASLTAMAGGVTTGRALMIALCKDQGADLSRIFAGEGYGPLPLTPAELHPNASVAKVPDAVDVPEWLWPQWSDSLGSDAEEAARAQQSRASVFLRVNKRLSDVDHAINVLAQDGITAVPHRSVATCLAVTEHARRVATSTAFRDGLVDVQDAASQAAILRMDIPVGAKVLDYCAGGGGKALAIAARHDGPVTAHDIAPDRMRDIAPRAQRAQASIVTCLTADLNRAGVFDLVICDAPCSGSGTWRRTPDAKWRLDQEKLSFYNALQSEVISKSAALTAPGGRLAYMTCSVLSCENDAIVAAFLREQPQWRAIDRMRLTPQKDFDGFYLHILQNGS